MQLSAQTFLTDLSEDTSYLFNTPFLSALDLGSEHLPASCHATVNKKGISAFIHTQKVKNTI